jgi:transcription-repair coupling factor (superfamily II helicase)
MLRAHVPPPWLRRGGPPRVPAPRSRVVEQLSESETPATLLEPGAQPAAGVRRRAEGAAARRLVVPGANLVIITETDLTATGSPPPTANASRQTRNVVDPLALTAAIWWLHDQHGIASSSR